MSNKNKCLFDAKSIYQIENNERGRAYKITHKPIRIKKRQIYDNMHLIDGMDFTPRFGFPRIQAYNGPTDFLCVPYTERQKYDGSNQAIHFFLHDFKFRDAVWCNLEYTTYTISQYDYLFTPDLSLWKDYPTDYYNMQNIFRTRFVGAYWQICGFKVIPTASWGSLNSFEYCFDGLPMNSVVAVCGMGNRKNINSYNQWCYGLRRLEEEKSPTLIMVYGEEIQVTGLHTPIKFIPDFISTNLRKIKKNGK